LKIFLDTSLLSDSGLAEFGGQIVGQVVGGSSFYVSSITHFQLLWGYSLAGMAPARYEEFLEQTGTEVVPLTKLDAKEAAGLKPGAPDLLDSLIAASVNRYEANLWTLDKDFLRFVPKSRVHVFRSRGEASTGATGAKGRRKALGSEGEE
jgi:predicted nucleic acid-binding protein